MKQFVLCVLLFICCINVVFGENDDYFCRINGVNYANGENVGTQVDGCAYCHCGGKGFVCAMNRCPLTSYTCQLDGKQYDEGDDVPSEDSKKCFCSNGSIVRSRCTS